MKYYYFGSQRVAMRGGNEVYYLHGDHLGSTSLTTNVTGTVVAETRHHPFGEVRWESNESVTDFGFTGQREEVGFGLMDYNARFYSPGLGRFVSADTIVPDFGNSQDLNRYTYVTNNPLNYTDPSGHCWGIFSGLRSTFLYGTTCSNLDKAIFIAGHPDASDYQKAQAVFYVEAVTIAHLELAIGLALGGCALNPTCATTATGAGEGATQPLATPQSSSGEDLKKMLNDADPFYRDIDDQGNPINPYGVNERDFNDGNCQGHCAFFKKEGYDDNQYDLPAGYDEIWHTDRSDGPLSQGAPHQNNHTKDGYIIDPATDRWGNSITKEEWEKGLYFRNSRTGETTPYIPSSN